MRFRRRQNSVPELNTTSTADISFMLLIFFLVTTNMDVDKGLMRQLPPADKQEQQESYVSKGTLMTIGITADNKLLIDGSATNVEQLRGRVIDFVRRVGSKHLVKVEVNPSARYEIYFQVQNALAAAYGMLREETSRRLFHRQYAALSPTERDQVKEACPQRIAEQYEPTGAVVAVPAQEGGKP